MHRIMAMGIGLMIWLPGKISGQHVLYSEPFNTRASIRYQLIGRSENFYWVEKRQKRRPENKKNNSDFTVYQSFQLLDAKLNLLKEWSAFRSPDMVKQWMVAGEKGLDQIVITRSDQQTKIIRSHFPLNENMDPPALVVDSLPYVATLSDLVLVRSEDQSKILLLAFEDAGPELNRAHALLFDADWNPVYHQVITRNLISQPCIQDEEIGFPAESFDNTPIKLANNGQWLMASSSRISNNFSLLHVAANGRDCLFREIPLTPYYKMEDIAMSIQNDLQEIRIGLLSGFKQTTFKNVQVVNYSMNSGEFDFDSSFRFNTQLRDIRDKNLSHESFTAVPGGGFMLLKEYGSPFEFSKPGIPVMNEMETAWLLTHYTEMQTDKDPVKPGYTFNRGLSPIPFIRNRGDLNLFYFPGFSKDSVWSGILEMEQHTETNNPDLSYLLIPTKDRMYIIYNRVEGSDEPMATTTTLNMQGQATGDALVFWRINKSLNFQQAHRFSAGEVAIPYYQQSGFAIIRL